MSAPMSGDTEEPACRCDRRDHEHRPECPAYCPEDYEPVSPPSRGPPPDVTGRVLMASGAIGGLFVDADRVLLVVEVPIAALRDGRVAVYTDVVLARGEPTP